ncbi:hypothetical protein M23134_01276 [Microscilla marina ATCC 23134]|uniref:Uncharacterized protein n=1 Tax=Microscilla marina ATCC 23134 TaxID=313606 RepID=A2A0E5_MICM2|nr:hypothetical protein M23134_01276 [Microscilla marina ATCC 23134]
MGNLRVAFREGEKKIYRADLEDVTTDKQQGFEYKEVIISSDPTSVSNHVAKLTSTEPLGMLRNLEVSKGDVVKVKGYYAGGSVTHNNAVNWGLTLGQVNGHAKSGEISTENTPFLLNLGLSITPSNGGNNPNATVPSGYLKLVFYKKDGTPVTASLQIAHLSPGAGQWQDLELTYTATERGYLQAFVANESDQEVFFDDMVVEHTPQLIVQENHYYPFGLELEGLSKHGKPEHRWKFQGQEEQKEFGLNWSSFKFRNADVALGRFFSVDPLSESFYYNSTYAFSENRVINGVELEGLEYVSAAKADKLGLKSKRNIINDSKGYIKYGGKNYYETRQHVYRDGNGQIYEKGGSGRTRISEWLHTKVSNPIKKSDFVEYQYGVRDCYPSAKLQMKTSGTETLGGFENAYFMHLTHPSGYKATEESKQTAIDIIHNAIEKGNFVVAGVEVTDEKGVRNDTQFGMITNNDNNTQHFINITGRGEDKKGKYFTFIDNSGDKGYEAQKLYVQPDGTLFGLSTLGGTGSNAVEYYYRVINVSPNKNQPQYHKK